MLNAYEVLNSEVKVKKKFPRFSFKYMAKKIIERQGHDKDTIIVICGERRNGKSNWGLNLIRSFMREKKKIDPSYRWNWKENFPLTRNEAIEKVESLPDGSFVFYDEGIDFMYRGDTLAQMNKALIKFMAKSGKKKLLTIIILPDIFTLDVKILNMAHFLVAVPYRFEEVCAFAFIFSRSPNPFIQDKFGLEKIKREFASRKVRKGLRSAVMSGEISVKVKWNERVTIPYPQELFTFLRRMDTFLYWHSFSGVNKKFEQDYIMHVKDKQLTMKDEIAFVKYKDWIKVCEKYETLIYNLYLKHGMKMAQIERLHINNVGMRLTNYTTLKKMIESMSERYANKVLIEDGAGADRELEGQKV